METFASMGPLEKTFRCMKEFFDCTICYSSLIKPVETECGHVFCSKCVNKVCESTGAAMCPICQAQILTRAVSERHDIEDLVKIFDKLNDVFTLELQRFVESKKVEVGEEMTKSKSCSSVQLQPLDVDIEQDTNDLDNNMLQHAYVLLTTSAVVPQVDCVTDCEPESNDEPLDLSLPPKSRTIPYIFQSAIKYVKPIDLSMKNQQQTVTVEVKVTDEVESETSIVVPVKPLPNKKKRLEKVSKPQNFLLPGVVVRTTRNQDVVNVGATVASVCEVSKMVTNSDEILGNMAEPEQVIVQAVSMGVGNVGMENDHTCKNISKEKDLFAFKQPSKIVQTSSTRDVDPKQCKRKYDELDYEDEFLRPRDSDLLFLDLTGTESESEYQSKSDNTIDDVENMPSTSKSAKENHRACKKITLGNIFKKSKEKKAQKVIKEHHENEIVMTKTQTHARKTLTDSAEPEPFDDDADIFKVWPNVNLEIPSKKNAIKERIVSWVGLSASKKYVFCPTRLNKAQMIKLQELSKMCNGCITKDFTNEVTHLVIDLVKGRVPQTLKYLLAIAGKKWVVIYDWVEKCVENGCVILEDEYETSNFEQCDPGVRRSRLAETPLFQDFTFYFATDQFKNMGYSFEEVLLLMKSLGATVAPCADEVEGDLIIIGDTMGRAADYQHWLATKQWITVTFSWIIDCVLEYKLVPFGVNHMCIEISNNELESAKVPRNLKQCISQFINQKF